MPSYTKDVSDKAEDAMAQIARLRDQVEALMRDKVGPVMEDTAERMGAAAHDAADLMRDRADELAATVRQRPLSAILVAAAVGFLLGRIGR